MSVAGVTVWGHGTFSEGTAMITTDFVPGSPCWLDLGSPDLDRAAEFYRSVFGWEFSSMGPDAGGYGFFQLDGRVVGALGPLTEEGARSAWTVYYTVPDAAATAKAVEQAGGAVRELADVGDEGRMVQLTDPQGARFAAWQAGAFPGLQAVNEPGALMWVELYTTDTADAKRFYGDVFGWTTTETPLPGGGGAYAMISPAEGGEERMQGGMMQLAAEHLAPAGGPYWHPVFQVTDCDAAVAAVTAGGGELRMGPDDAPGVGRLAVCTDPFGADFVVLVPDPN